MITSDSFVLSVSDSKGVPKVEITSDIAETSHTTIQKGKVGTLWQVNFFDWPSDIKLEKNTSAKQMFYRSTCMHIGYDIVFKIVQQNNSSYHKDTWGAVVQEYSWVSLLQFD